MKKKCYLLSWWGRLYDTHHTHKVIICSPEYAIKQIEEETEESIIHANWDKDKLRCEGYTEYYNFIIEKIKVQQERENNEKIDSLQKCNG